MPHADHPLLPPEVQAAYRASGDWDDTPLVEHVRRTAVARPEARAVVGTGVVTYPELLGASLRLAGGLAALGARAGDAVVALLPMTWEAVAVAVAASALDVTLLPLAPNVAVDATLDLAARAGARHLLLASSACANPAWTIAAAEWKSAGGSVVVHDLGDGTAPEPDGTATLADLLERGPAFTPVDPDCGRPRLVLSTSGTTGRPKGVVHSENTVTFAARNYGRSLQFTEHDVWVSFFPFGSAMSSVFATYTPLLHGGTILCIPTADAVAVADAVARWGGTVSLTVATHLQDWLGLPDADRKKLATITRVTSAVGPPHLYGEAEGRLGLRVSRVYGQSECLGHALSRPGDPPSLRLHNDGVPWDAVDARLLGPGDTEVPNGLPGEYVVRGPSLFLGYLGQPELTREVMTPEGFFRTGDLVTRNDAGYVTWAGRISDMIPRRGMHVDAIRLEHALAVHPQVHEVVVVGAPASTGEPAAGDDVVVVASLVPGGSVDLGALHQHLATAGLPAEWFPDALVVVDALPRTGTGKYHRAAIKQLVADSTARAEGRG